MLDYQAMYAFLFRKITAILEQLREVRQGTEEMYISARSPEIRVIGFGKRHGKRNMWNSPLGGKSSINGAFPSKRR